MNEYYGFMTQHRKPVSCQIKAQCSTCASVKVFFVNFLCSKENKQSRISEVLALGGSLKADFGEKN